MTWNHWFMRFALLAALKSKDLSTQVGAVIVRDNRILSVGYNGLPIGVHDPFDFSEPDKKMLSRRTERPEKYHWVEHAERNAIYHAARNGVSIMGSTLYVTGPPCENCTRGIIQAGIKKVFYLKYYGYNKDKWIYERSFRMMDEAGVAYFEDREMYGEHIKIDGQIISV